MVSAESQSVWKVLNLTQPLPAATLLEAQRHQCFGVSSSTVVRQPTDQPAGRKSTWLDQRLRADLQALTTASNVFNLIRRQHHWAKLSGSRIKLKDQDAAGKKTQSASTLLESSDSQLVSSMRDARTVSQRLRWVCYLAIGECRRQPSFIASSLSVGVNIDGEAAIHPVTDARNVSAGLREVKADDELEDVRQILHSSGTTGNGENPGFEIQNCLSGTSDIQPSNLPEFGYARVSFPTDLEELTVRLQPSKMREQQTTLSNSILLALHGDVGLEGKSYHLTSGLEHEMHVGINREGTFSYLLNPPKSPPVKCRKFE
ncbi:hypothetical protein A1Q1_06019 [Trichosporon asahii var. asahii CBS 2479]|uniref:Uncharacterized protein n=1 Tax=Trichosporon asahii var. asahii (strain ATCC 90039 / CBS 2479 / JCM 2466 / KCTC 7840 / NBRC 103889/ NCYC 2677 / UAMH 7654) TaxID=1186058 RepID=J5Q5I9_TRIAS|nr:hypothetical protein A1Q1_06019 [Trichosporon asahii var. asahii CBS 2479]EJT45573.1 hypothetical protein A1Q1_06019 [Trichosporon asahii var. asahii CBS 2479]